MSVDDEARIVEFKLILAGMAEAYVRAGLARAARAQGRRLPKQTDHLLRTGALAAVARLGPPQLADFVRANDWDRCVAAAVESGAWGRLIAQMVRLAFTPDAG